MNDGDYQDVAFLMFVDDAIAKGEQLVYLFVVESGTLRPDRGNRDSIFARLTIVRTTTAA